MVENGNSYIKVNITSQPNTTMEIARRSRPDSGIAGAELRSAIDKPFASNTTTKHTSHSNNSSRRSSHSSSRLPTSRVAGDLPRYHRPALHSYSYSTSSRKASTTEELNALYFRSCAIMRSDSVSNEGPPDVFPSSGVSEKSSTRSQPISIISDPTPTIPLYSTRPNGPTRANSSNFISSRLPIQSRFTEPVPHTTEPVPIEAIAPTTTHWLSSETRAKQYAEIERSCKGWRAFWKKATRSEKKARKTQDHLIDFYNEENGDDGASVRRYRIDIDDEYDEKDEGIRIQRSHEENQKGKRKGWLGTRR